MGPFIPMDGHELRAHLGAKPDYLRTSSERLLGNLRSDPVVRPALPQYEVHDERGQHVLYERIAGTLFPLYRAMPGEHLVGKTQREFAEFVRLKKLHPPRA